MKRLALLTISLVSLSCLAQVPTTLSSAEIYAGLKKLNVLGSVLYIAAHPDDENTRLLAYLSKEKLYRTGYLSLTRGDGGQNLIGEEQGVELGLIRTQELLAARRIDGAEQFFSRAYDFGFSKTADETLSKWNKEKILSDIVWVIRKFQPDVIITRFPADSRAGHGHHWSSSLLANEAFYAAADANRFVEHFKYGVKPWQAKRILWNAFIPSGPVPDSIFRVDVGVYNSLLGKSYGEIASESRSNHKSQGFGAARTRGETFENFITTGGDKPVKDLLDGIDISWNRTGNINLQHQIDKAIKDFRFDQPFASVQQLIALYRSFSQLAESYWRNQKLKELQRIIESATGLFADATATSSTAVQGDSLRINFVVNKRSSIDVTLLSASMENFDTALQSTLPANKNYLFSRSFIIPQNQKISQPYWLEHSLPNGSFDVKDQQLIGMAENEVSFKVQYTVNIAGETFTLSRPVQYKFTDPVKGEIYQPVSVLPKLLVKASPGFIVVSKYINNKYNVEVKAMSELSADTLILHRTSASKEELSSIQSHLSKGTEINTEYFGPGYPASGEQKISLSDSKEIFNKGMIEINYDHIPLIRYFKEPVIKLATTELIPGKGKKIGYILGAGDALPEALKQMGYSVTELDANLITENTLRSLDAVITGIRAYNIHSYLFDKYNVLMDYVKQGGNLIVQFNTNSGAGPMREKIGPYNFSISRNRVTEEDAKVEFALPEHSVLNFPNKITQEDFNGWVQERSVYEADQFDNSFATPLVMNDKGERPGKGSLIIASYGKGNFVYTGLALFRQIPAGVTGAYKLLANLIALPKR
jgi:LmbE family N-acetylglucosaminyl deacetylase